MNTKISIAKSFSARLSLFIAIVVAPVFSVTSVMYYRFARKIVQEEAVEKAHGLLSNTILEIDKMLYSVEVAVGNMAWNVVENLEDPDYMYSVTERLLENNPFIYGSAVAFDPYYYADIGLYFSPYSFRRDNKIHNTQLGSNNYDYHHMEWFQIPRLMRKPYWSEPYFDESGGSEMMITYSYPLFDQYDDLFGILTADVSLKWLTDQINAIQVYPDSYNFMIGRGGTYLVHKNNERILNETIFIVSHETEDKSIEELGRKMLAGEKGHTTLWEGEDEAYIFYAPIKSIGWSVAIVCPYKNVFLTIYHLRTILWFIAIFGLAFMLVFCYTTIKRHTDPLKEFAQSAHEISHGNFAVKLPKIRSKDEMKLLHDSFEYMQKSLVEYIEELKSTTADNERIESELRIASRIQMGMVPKKFPPFQDRGEISMFASINPAREVGGDLYDFFIDKGYVYFIIGDVSGKGVPASLLMSVTCSMFRTIASYFHSAAKITSTLNSAFTETNEANMFVTFFIGVLDLENGRIQYCNAGHNAPIIMTPEGKVSYMKTETNIALGVFKDFDYKESEIDFPVGSSIFLYTDGVTEAENMAKTLYSEERLLNVIKGIKEKDNPQKVISTVLDDIKDHSSNAEQSDDITLLSIHYNHRYMEKRLILQNDISQISSLGSFINEIADELSLARDIAFNLNLVLEEAVSNVIMYAYPTHIKDNILLDAKLDGNSLTFTLTDSGEPFDPTMAPDADITLSAEERKIGGLGIFLIRKIMNKVEYKRIKGKNIFILTKEI